MKRMDGSSRKGLSPLLAIIIGLIVTIVAGILLAQLYFSYAATISARPAANIEYVDLIENGDNDILVINVKNTGNVPIDIDDVTINGAGGAACSTSPGNNTDIQPGETFSITCTGGFVPGSGEVWSGSITFTFTDGSRQSYAISVRARSA